MEKISEMIERMCPDGVEFEAVGSLVKKFRGADNKSVSEEARATKEKTREYSYPVMSCGTKPFCYNDEFNHEGELIVISGTGSGGYTSYFNEPVYVCGQPLCFVSSNEGKILTKFLYFYLKSKQAELMGSEWCPTLRRDFRRKDFCDTFLIPVPPIEIQNRIVEALDKMTELEREIEREIELRKKQYEYYLKQLMSF